MADMVTLAQVRSSNGSSKKQLATLQSLGLGRIGRTVQRRDDAVLRGQVAAVAHLVEVRT